MMRLARRVYFYIEPEVAGGLGANTMMDRSLHPPIVTNLHYQFDGWPGDVLLESFPCFVVTECAKQKLQAAQLVGATFEEAEVTTSEQFRELYPNRQLPKFVWLRVEGKPGQDDFGTTPDGRLVVSERALEVLQSLGISQALVTEFALWPSG
jgi:hypothetical protein